MIPWPLWATRGRRRRSFISQVQPNFFFMVASSEQGTSERAALTEHVRSDYAAEEGWE